VRATLNPPWRSYILHLLPAGLSPHERTRRMSNCTWVGAEARIAASRHAADVGKAGVVLWVSEELLHLLTEDGRLVSVLRGGCRVEVAVPEPLRSSLQGPVILQGRGCP
jgi:RNase P/RNase MRP subunit p29